MEKDYIISIDQGTTSSRAILFNTQGKSFKYNPRPLAKNNSNFYFVYLPEYSRYQINYSNYTYNQVKQVVDELNIPFIDIHKEVFEKESNPLKLFSFGVYGNNVEGYRAGHYNVEGYRKAAEAIIRKIN